MFQGLIDSSTSRLVVAFSRLLEEIQSPLEASFSVKFRAFPWFNFWVAAKGRAVNFVLSVLQTIKIFALLREDREIDPRAKPLRRKEKEKCRERF